jgi:hypothetical protein
MIFKKNRFWQELSGGSTSRRFSDRHPLGNLIFSFFLHKNEKIRVILPRKDFENRFFSMIATPWINRHLLTDFLDPPLQELSILRPFLSNTHIPRHFPWTNRLKYSSIGLENFFVVINFYSLPSSVRRLVKYSLLQHSIQLNLLVTIKI